jgi:predicted O-methyltransferase YrrM
MLIRIHDFYDFFAISERERTQGKRAAALAGEKAQGMTDINDYEALAAIALHFRPHRIFEIGTYLGITSDFFLSLLPECRVVSIAYQNPRWRFFGKSYNNSELTRKQIGSKVLGDRRTRFTQLYGDSHELESQSLLREHGHFDLVFIDGDHSREGVSQDTELAKKVITESGVICWHDANPKTRYIDVRRFLEEELSLPAIATKDEYIGGIACWSREIEDRLKSDHKNSQQSAAADSC